MHLAEDTLMKDFAICPAYFYTNPVLLSKRVKDFYQGSIGHPRHRLRRLHHRALVRMLVLSILRRSKHGKPASHHEWNQGDPDACVP
jgi:hypothetical protein